MLRSAIAAVLAFCAPAMAQDYVFEWQGSGGYSMRGAVSFPPGEDKGILTQSQVQCFEIEGFRDGVSIGRWALGMLTEETSWLLQFDPDLPGFVTASAAAPMPQAWNMNGAGVDCGEGGFGFNLGNAAQDLCVDNTLLIDSQVPPATPFPATEVSGHLFSPDACFGVMVTSRQMR